ncbi:META domain-containing protein [Patescibacteria group bacterium]|nr:META domain-containing protein [Patescibacteria group bacterium]
MKKLFFVSMFALLITIASPAQAEVGGTITRTISAPVTINTLVKTLLELVTWESNHGTITFSNGHYSLSAGCNLISGAYSIDGTTVDFEDPVSTMMYCDGKMENESTLINTVATATTLSFKDGALVLSQGTTTTRFAATFENKSDKLTR